MPVFQEAQAAWEVWGGMGRVVQAESLGYFEPMKRENYGRDLCECGREKTVKRGGEWQCARCASILPQDYHTVEGGGRALVNWRKRDSQLKRDLIFYREDAWGSRGYKRGPGGTWESLYE